MRDWNYLLRMDSGQQTVLSRIGGGECLWIEAILNEGNYGKIPQTKKPHFFLIKYILITFEVYHLK